MVFFYSYAFNFVKAYLTSQLAPLHRWISIIWWFCIFYITVNWTTSAFNNDHRMMDGRIIKITSLIIILYISKYILYTRICMYNNIIYHILWQAFIANTNMTVLCFFWSETGFFLDWVSESNEWSASKQLTRVSSVYVY